MHKCTICEAEAPYQVKGTPTYYCEKHAIEFFGDVTYLVKAEGTAQVMKDLINSHSAE